MCDPDGPRNVCKIWSSSLEPFSKYSARSRRKQYFRHFFRYNFRPEVDNDVISAVAIDYVGVDIPIKFGDSRSKRSRDIRRAGFVSNERKNEHDKAYPNTAKRLFIVLFVQRLWPAEILNTFPGRSGPSHGKCGMWSYCGRRKGCR